MVPAGNALGVLSKKVHITTPSILINTLTNHFTFYQGLIQDSRKSKPFEIGLLICICRAQIVLISTGNKKNIKKSYTLTIDSVFDILISVLNVYSVGGKNAKI